MRLGGPVLATYADPDEWVASLRRLDYSAAPCPVDSRQSDEMVRAYAEAAAAADVVIAEVGAWSNPLSPDEATRRAAIAYCQEQLALADRIGARCCVNIAGSRGEVWMSPHPDNLTEETFALIVESVRAIVDAVRPKRAFYTLETMPWMYPDSADVYLRLIQAVQRSHFAAHLDLVNLICSPQKFYRSGALLRECVDKLGPYIKSCHAKDIALANQVVVHLDEVRIGLGGLDYRGVLPQLDRLGPDLPVILEHLPDEKEYALAASHIRSVAAEAGVLIKQPRTP